MPEIATRSSVARAPASIADELIRKATRWIMAGLLLGLAPGSAAAQSNDFIRLLGALTRPPQQPPPMQQRRALPPAYNTAPAYRPAPSQDRRTVRQAQEMLNGLGYDAGPVDGAAGRRTVAALKRFQVDFGLPATGVAESATMTALSAALRARQVQANPAQPVYPGAPTAPVPIPSGLAVSPGFDCMRASSPTEHAICGSPDLAGLDGRLTTVYAARMNALSGGTAEAERARQRAWLARRNGCGSDGTCLAGLYRTRLAELGDTGGSMPPAPNGTGRVASAPPPPPSVLTATPEGLAPLEIHIWQGLPVFNHPGTTDDEAFFRLLALGAMPALLEERARFNDNARLMANLLLAPEEKKTFLSQRRVSEGREWAGSNEFERDDMRRRFLEAYRPVLLAAAPKPPLRFIYLREAFLSQQYDPALKGFPLRWSVDPPSALSQDVRLGWLKPAYAFDFPGFFWPIEEVAARDALATMAEGITNSRDARVVNFAVTMEITGVDVNAMTFEVALRGLDLYDHSLTRRLHSYVVETPDDTAASDTLAKLLAPPTGVQPPYVVGIEGVPLVNQSHNVTNNGRDFFGLVAIGSASGYLESLGTRAPAMYLTQGYREPFVGRFANRWEGADEFAREDTRRRFVETYGPTLKDYAPKAPFDFAYALEANVGEYDGAKGGFPMQFGSGTGGAPPMPLDFAGIKPGVSFPWPDMLIRKSPEEARAFSEHLLAIAQRMGMIGHENEPMNPRALRLVVFMRMAGLGSDGLTADMRMTGVRLYDRALKERVHDFPLEEPLAEAPPTVAETAALDDAYLRMQIVAALGEKAHSEMLKAYASDVWRRDMDLYRRPSAWANLPEGDPGRPFFPNSQTMELTIDRIPALAEQARRDAARMPKRLVASFSGDLTPGDGKSGLRFAAAGFVHGKKLDDGNPLLAGLDVQANQVKWMEVLDDHVMLVLPNSQSLYGLDITREQIADHTYARADFEVRFDLEEASPMRTDDGGSLLLLRLAPLSMKASLDGTGLAARDFADVPRLDAASFTGDAGAGASLSTGESLEMDAALIDLLAASAVGDAMSPEALVHLVARRWALENETDDPLGGRFFVAGKRMPTETEAADLAPRFLTWAKGVAPGFPLRLATTAEIRLKGDAQRLEWSSLPCFAGPSQDTRIVTSTERRGLNSCQTSRDFARQGTGSRTPDDERRCLATAAAVDTVDFMQPFANMCRPKGQPLSFPDPGRAYMAIPSHLRAPPPAPLQGTERRLSLTATFEVSGIRRATQEPRYTDLLPPRIMQRYAQRSSARPDGDFAVFDAKVVDVVYRDEAGVELARFDGADDSDLSAIVAAFEAGMAATEPESARGGAYGPDIVGIRLGMGFDDAEKLVREHMKVGKVMDGKRASDPAVAAGVNEPATSGRLFVSQDNYEMIALVDEPPAAEGRVLGVWRRVLSPSGRIRESEVFLGLEARYGKPTVGRFQQGVRNLWFTEAGGNCSVLYQWGQRQQLAALWYEDGKPTAWQLPDRAQTNTTQEIKMPSGVTIPYRIPSMAQPAEAAILPKPYFDPLSDEAAGYGECGPFLTAEVKIDTTVSSMPGAYIPIDVVEMTLTDIGPYRAAYEESRAALQAKAVESGKATTATPGSIKF